MKIKGISPFIGRIIQEDGREQWYIMWRGEEYAKYDTYEAAEKVRLNLIAMDKNGMC